MISTNRICAVGMVVILVMISACSSDSETVNIADDTFNGEEMTEYAQKMDTSLKRELRRQQSENISEVVSVLIMVDKEMVKDESRLDDFKNEMEESGAEIRSVVGHIISIRSTPEVLIEIMKNEHVIRMEKSQSRSN